jgi:hypothetical protein
MNGKAIATKQTVGNVVFTQQVYWARMKGYSPWPGRLCSKTEAIALQKKSGSKKDSKSDLKAMVFFGNKRSMCENGYC